MTTDEALSQLRDGWALRRDGDDWIIGTFEEEDAFLWLGCAPTVGEAIEIAVGRFEQDERAAAERAADDQRRTAAGELTPLARASVRPDAIWAPELVRAMAADTALWRIRAVTHRRCVRLTDGRELVHECDGADCRALPEAIEAGFSDPEALDSIGCFIDPRPGR